MIAFIKSAVADQEYVSGEKDNGKPDTKMENI